MYKLSGIDRLGIFLSFLLLLFFLYAGGWNILSSVVFWEIYVCLLGVIWGAVWVAKGLQNRKNKS